MKRFGFLLSISLFWLVLSALSDGITALLLPQRLLAAGSPIQICRLNSKRKGLTLRAVCG